MSSFPDTPTELQDIQADEITSLPPITKASLEQVRSQEFFEAQLKAMRTWAAEGLTDEQAEDRVFSFIIWVLTGMPEGKVKAEVLDAWWEIHQAACQAEFDTFNDKCEAEFYRCYPDSRTAN